MRCSSNYWWIIVILSCRLRLMLKMRLFTLSDGIDDENINGRDINIDFSRQISVPNVTIKNMLMWSPQKMY